MLDVTLKIDNKDKKFKANFISAGLFKDALQVSNSFMDIADDSITEELSDTMVAFIVKTFNNQFTAEDVYNGLGLDDMFPLFMKCIETIMEKFKSKVSQFSDPNSQTGKVR